jgi:hypothetical protein
MSNYEFPSGSSVNASEFISDIPIEHIPKTSQLKDEIDKINRLIFDLWKVNVSTDESIQSLKNHIKVLHITVIILSCIILYILIIP